MRHVTLIAEAGENHCGDMAMAEKLVAAAAAAGADYVKFQLYDAADAAPDDPEKQWFERVALGPDQLVEIHRWCRAAGIRPLCTPWDAAKARRLYDHGFEDMKIASFHLTDLELLRQVAARSRRVFLSTGMAELPEVDRAVEALDAVPELFLMHCVSEYPLVPERVNLRVMETLRRRYPRARIGYSDHTVGIEAAVLAAAAGAEVIEKHITLDHRLEGTDHVLSADPAELRQLVAGVRRAEVLLGEPTKRLTDEERRTQSFLRGRFRHRVGAPEVPA